MSILFVLIAVCPAIIVTKYGTNEESTWKSCLSKFAGWFYAMTLANLALLYQQGWGSFDFTSWSVQFLAQFMVNSIAVAICAFILQKIFQKVSENSVSKEEGYETSRHASENNHEKVYIQEEGLKASGNSVSEEGEIYETNSHEPENNRGGGIVKKGLLMEPCWLKESWKGGVKQS